jgi:hypothetical protein
MIRMCLAALALAIGATAAQAQKYDPATGQQIVQQAVGGAPLSNANPLTVISPITTYEGTLTLAGATSTALTSGNVTLAPNSAALPSTFVKLTLINIGANPGFVCWFGGAASASSGCEMLAAGASDTVNLGGFATPPALFSTAGTTFSFRN